MRRAPAWHLVVVALASIGFLVASALYSQHMAARLDEDAASIAGNASPSIEALSAARGALLRAEVAIARAIEGSPGDIAAEHQAAQDALRRMRAHQIHYLSLPFYPDERNYWNQVDAATHEFEDQLATCFAALERGRREEARAILMTKLRPAAERLDGALEVLVSFDVAQQHRMGMEIPKLRRRAARVAFLFDGVSSLLAVVLIALVVRESRRRQQLLTHFSQRLEGIATSTVRITRAVVYDGNERSVLNEILKEACRLVDADYAALGFLADRDQPFDTFVSRGVSAAEEKAIGRLPRPAGILGDVCDKGRALRLDDVGKYPGFRGLPPGHPPVGPFLGVPLRRDGRGTGNLYLARRPGRDPFTEEDEHIIELLATQAAVSTENAKLYREQGAQRRRAEILADASARMVGSLDYETTLDQAASAALPAFADVCILHLTEENGAIAKTVMAAADPAWRLFFSELTPRPDWPPESHPVVRVLRERRPVHFAVDGEILDQLAQHAEQRRQLQQIPLKHGLSVPMVGRARLLGVLSFFTFRETGFGDRDVAFALELAHRAALSIDNAILHERTQRAVQARDDLLAIVSHDLRNPLSSIHMSIQLLQRGTSLAEEKRRELADRIARTVVGMRRLIEDLLDASKIESGSFQVQPKPEPVEPLLADALDLFRDCAMAKSISLKTQIGQEVPAVLCDRDRVLQVLSNLIGNALKFTPTGGAITIGADSLANAVRFSVCDTGPGIAEAQRRQVFDRYWQASHARRAGAGLGLFIVKGIVEAHGGHAWAETAPGGGACLCFTLPT
jgi:signal transduction histidine kinase